MRKGIIIAIAAGAAGLAIAVAITILFSKDPIEKALDAYEHANYRRAIKMLNHLLKTADYETAEKLHYYRCRAVNGLARQLEEKFSDELSEAAQEKRHTEGFRRAKHEIEEYLANCNEEIEGDLAFVPAMKKSRIVPRGRFYDEFVARYRGSAYIQDIQFEQIEAMAAAEPDRLIPAIVGFYRAFPRSDYLARMVRIIFDALQRGDSGMKGNEEAVWEIIIAYAKRYPTSPETGRIFTCTGDKVNLRNSPGTEGKLVGKVDRDAICIQLEKSMDTTQVGDVRDYWYRIATLKGQRGWIFGKFLAPADLSKYREPETAESWSIEERFAEWIDSHTPANWTHLPEADPAGISFSAVGGRKIASVSSRRGTSAGLFMRSNAPRAFTIKARGRFAGGDGLTLFAYVIGTGAAYVLKMRPGAVDVSGRTVPLNTAAWHDYELSSEDGRYATLRIDGEVVSSRIEAVKSPQFQRSGIYSLCSSKDESSQGEIEYLKIR